MTTSSFSLNFSLPKRKLGFPLRAEALLCAFIGCNSSPCAPPPKATPDEGYRAHVAPTSVASATASPGQDSVPTPTGSGVPLAERTEMFSRARLDLRNTSYLVDFPTSISEDRRRIAAMISVETELERLLPQWIFIKNLNLDRIEQKFSVVDGDLAMKLGYECENNLAACIPEAQQRIDEANALLAQDRWHPFPCLSVRGSERNERMGPGCELLAELDFKYTDPLLIVSRAGRTIASPAMPTWSPMYHKPACHRVHIDTYVESIAFDPETGLFVIGLSFVGPEGNAECPTPDWDFHPIRLPMLRRKEGTP